MSHSFNSHSARFSVEKVSWFIAGMITGCSLIALSPAALPTKKRALPRTETLAKPSSSMHSEIRGGKVNIPELENDFANLARAEGKYAETWDQQQKISAASGGRVMPSAPRPQTARSTSPLQQRKKQ